MGQKSKLKARQAGNKEGKPPLGHHSGRDSPRRHARAQAKAGTGRERRLPPIIIRSRKSSGGVWGLFQESPSVSHPRISVSPYPYPPVRHGDGGRGCRSRRSGRQRGGGRRRRRPEGRGGAGEGQGGAVHADGGDRGEFRGKGFAHIEEEGEEAGIVAVLGGFGGGGGKGGGGAEPDKVPDTTAAVRRCDGKVGNNPDVQGARSEMAVLPSESSRTACAEVERTGVTVTPTGTLSGSAMACEEGMVTVQFSPMVAVTVCSLLQSGFR